MRWVKEIVTKDIKERRRGFVDKLKNCRAERGLTQSAVAEMLGRSQEFISRVEAGTRTIDFVEFQLLVAIYRKEISFFAAKPGLQTDPYLGKADSEWEWRGKLRPRKGNKTEEALKWLKWKNSRKRRIANQR